MYARFEQVVLVAIIIIVVVVVVNGRARNAKRVYETSAASNTLSNDRFRFEGTTSIPVRLQLQCFETLCSWARRALRLIHECM